MEINNHLEDEIDLRDLINHLIKLKIIIIITTFIFALMAASYNYLTPKQEPIYTTTVRLIIGDGPQGVKFIQENIQDIGNLIGRVSFYFPEPGTILKTVGDKFLEIKLVGPSIEKNTYSLTEMANYVISNSEDIIDNRKRELNREISYISKQIENIFISLDNIPSNHDLYTNKELLSYYVKTNAKLNELLHRKELLLTTLDTNLFSSSSIFGDILSVQLRQTQDKSKINILFSAIAGLLLSIFVILFRHIFLKKQE
jgi:hypothetical protein